MKRERRYEQGQTLLEIVVAVGVIALVLTALVTAVTASLRFSQSGRFRSQAVKYAQEGIELTRKLRDTRPWTEFTTYSGAGTATWCLSESGEWTTSDGSGCPLTPTSNFWRTITLTLNGSVMDVVSSVSWGERTQSSTVTLRTYLSDWRQ
jgi:type II secretory pathway pseudopilin PulG